MSRPATFDRLRLLPAYNLLDNETQTELARAARAYASAIWWANEDPNQSWLQLTTAIETAAKFNQLGTASADNLVEQLWPELWAALLPADPAVRTAICTLVAPQMKATKTFVDFIVKYAPEPPDHRPESEWDQVLWTDMYKMARVIYGHRSTALHAAKPFPLPMLERPRVGPTGDIQEGPEGLSGGGLGGTWSAKETPMLLNTFEHITRGSLLNWWAETLADAAGD